MVNNVLNEKILSSIYKEYQAIWLIDANDLSMQNLVQNKQFVIDNSVEIASELKYYEKAYKWYIDNYVVESQRDRVLLQADMTTVLEKTADGNPYFVEYGRLRHGQINYNQLCFDRIVNDDGELLSILLGFRDIDIRKKAELDDLTGLLTRQVFFHKAEELLKSMPDEQFDIIISDIKDFKKINEVYGEKIADDILRCQGDFLSPAISDTLLIGRYGGDRMVLFGTHENIKKVRSHEAAELYFEAMRRSGLPTTITKFGVYENVEHNISIISNCDKALLALSSIKDNYDEIFAFYDDSIKRKIAVQRRIEECMYNSLKQGDFKVYYQPKHDTVTGRIVGAEALIRWIHPEYGFMSPGDFIPLFEKNGFVVECDHFVWKRTCENLKRWQNKGIRTVPISINASKLTIEKPDLITRIQEPVKDNQISPKQLHLEVTETLMENNIDELVTKLNSLRLIGYQIELDDFGAGYSSINTLSTLPIDVVKLDMSFMKEFGDAKRSKVLAASINLAKELGYKTVSEGVEYEEQCEVLGILGVDIIQGYLYSKPLPEEEFEQYLMKY